MPIAFDFGAVSDVGSVRALNEDSAHCSRNLLVVADGVAGSPAGEVASALVVETLRQAHVEINDSADPRAPLKAAARAAKARLAQEVQRHPRLTGMATTMTAVCTGRSGEVGRYQGGELGLVHVGDSRLYVLHAGRLFQLTRDHSLPQLLVEQGRITPAQAEHHPQRSVIVRSMTADGDVDADLVLLLALLGQRFILCSDGLSDYVSAQQLSDLAPHGTPQEAAHALLQAALKSGSRDNISVVVADVVDDGQLPDAELTLGAASEGSRAFAQGDAIRARDVGSRLAAARSRSQRVRTRPVTPAAGTCV